MKKWIAILWTVAFISCVFDAFNGASPSWTHVFATLIPLLIYVWEDVYDN